VRPWKSLARNGLRSERGYVLIMVMLVLVVVGIVAAVLLGSVSRNQQHVRRDRAYAESLTVAEAGLNQYLWMIASNESCEANDFAIPGNTAEDQHTQTLPLAVDLPGGGTTVMGEYTMQITPPSVENPLVTVTVTGRAESPVDVSRTISASIGRPSFSEYVMLTDAAVWVGGPIDRQWWGKTHSNVQVRIDTANINDVISCSRATYNNNNGVYSTISAVTNHPNSVQLWEFPVPTIDFDTVTSDFARLRGMATTGNSYAYVTPSSPNAAHGWYIRLGPGDYYQVARVTGELERHDYVSGLNRGGYLTYGTLTSVPYPTNGIIFVNDNVWVEGTGVTKRVTIAASGQSNSSGQTASINIVGDLTYAAKDGTAAIGLIAQQDIKIPMYAPMGKAGTMGTNWTTNVGTVDMEIDAALIAQNGCEFVNFNSSATAPGPRRGLLTIYGSVSSFATPYRYSVDGSGNTYAGFGRGANVYDSFLLHSPPPNFPTVGSYQILEWQELPSTMELEPTTTTI
jgi:Tfp pilus assembly protein PilE